MNPFTNYLRQWLSDHQFDAFVAYWDRLEQLTIQVYRQKITVEAAQLEFDEVWPWLWKEYGRWQALLEPFWQQSTAAGDFTQTDPFLLLLKIQSPADIPGDWRLMQHLPAARETLNQYALTKG